MNIYVRKCKWQIVIYVALWFFMDQLGNVTVAAFSSKLKKISLHIAKGFSFYSF